MPPLWPRLEMDPEGLRSALVLALEFLGRDDIRAATVGEALEASGLCPGDRERVRMALALAETLETRGRRLGDVEKVTLWKNVDGMPAGLTIRWKPARGLDA